MQWIETKNKLPKDCEDVLVGIKNVNSNDVHLEIGHYDYDRLNWYGFDDYPIHEFGFFVAYWMPLPKKPE